MGINLPTSKKAIVGDGVGMLMMMIVYLAMNEIGGVGESMWWMMTGGTHLAETGILLGYGRRDSEVFPKLRRGRRP